MKNAKNWVLLLAVACPIDPNEAGKAFLERNEANNKLVANYAVGVTIATTSTDPDSMKQTATITINALKTVRDLNVVYTDKKIVSSSGDNGKIETIQDSFIGEYYKSEIESSKPANRFKFDLNKKNYRLTYVSAGQIGGRKTLKYSIAPLRHGEEELYSEGSELLVDAETCLARSLRGKLFFSSRESSVMSKPIEVTARYQTYDYNGTLVSMPVSASTTLSFKSGWKNSLFSHMPIGGAGNLRLGLLDVQISYENSLPPAR